MVDETRFKTLRTSTTGNTPVAGSREVGELYVNFPDKRLGVIDEDGVASDLIGLRLFSDKANYVAGHFVVNPMDNQLYRAVVPIPAKAFQPAQWEKILNLRDFNPKALYIPNEVVLYHGAIYQCTATHSGEWVPNNFNNLSSSGVPVGGAAGQALVKLSTANGHVGWATLSTGTGGSSVVVSYDAPVGAPDGTLWWSSADGNMKILYNDGSSTQWVDVLVGTAGLKGDVGDPGLRGIDGLSGGDGQDGIDGTNGINGTDGQDGAGVSIAGTDTIASILGKAPAQSEMWIASDTNAGATPPGNAGDGYVWDLIVWTNVGPMRGPVGIQGIPGADGGNGADGTDGTDGKGITVYEQSEEPPTAVSGDIWIRDQ